jgi:hypothetical protein
MGSVDNKVNGADTFFTVETRLLSEFDQFVLDCKDFTNQFYSHQQKQPASVASKLAFWSNRKLGGKLQKLLNSLNKREEEFDTQLRSVMDESLTNFSSLTLQATHLKSRLLSCMDFNRKEMEILGTQMSELQRLSFVLSQTDKDTKEILHFVNEVIVQGDAQLERNLIYFSGETDPKEIIGFTTRDRSLVIRRLHMVREVQGRTSHIFSEVFELYKKHQGILRICQASYNLLREIPRDVIYNLKYESGEFVSVGTFDGCPKRCLECPRAMLVGSQVLRDPSMTDKTSGDVVGALEKYFLQPDDKISLFKPLTLTALGVCSAGDCRADRVSEGSCVKNVIGCDSLHQYQSKIEDTSKDKESQRCDVTPLNSQLSVVSNTSDSSVPNSGTGEVFKADSKCALRPVCNGNSSSVGGGECSNSNSSTSGNPFNWCMSQKPLSADINAYTALTDLNFVSLARGEETISRNVGFAEEEKEVSDEDLTYDHTQCCDCSVVDDLARDCFARLSAMHRKAAESFGRLEVLLEIREELINISMTIRARKTF